VIGSKTTCIYVLKSGGNNVHGTLFEFIRNHIFDARNFFDAGKPEFRRNQYGGMVSGPLTRSRRIPS
jgi:hypothetical protein